MPDLHTWISERIAEVEQLATLISPGGYEPDEWRIEPSRSGRWTQIVAYSRTLGEPPEAAARDSDQPIALVQTGRNEHLLIAMHSPAAVLRRCVADRKILEVHAPAGSDWEPYGCNGCGIDSEYGHEVRHTNDCETLIALAEGYGLTEGQRAALDRPEPEPPKRTERSLISDEFARTLYGQLFATFLGTQPVELRPEVKAMEILAPELKKIPGYVPIAEEESGA